MTASVSSLDLDALQGGTLSRLWLDLTEDALVRPLAVPVLVAKGRRDGPVVGITAAVHGNEVNGMRAIHHLVRHLDLTRLRGTVVAVPVVNITGFLLHQRRTDENIDLNHAFPGTATGGESAVFAHRFFQAVIMKLDVLVDLHTASFGRLNCLYVRADLSDPTTRAIAILQRPQVLLHNPPSDGTLRGAAAHAGVTAITVEIGNPHRIQREYVRRSVGGLRALLAHLEMVPRRHRAPVDKALVCKRSEWLYTDRGGLLEVQPKVADPVDVNELLALQRDPFGDVVREYHAPFSGVVIGANADPVASLGTRMVHLGELASPADLDTWGMT